MLEVPGVEIDRRTTEMNYQQIFREVCVITKLAKVATRAPCFYRLKIINFPWAPIFSDVSQVDNSSRFLLERFTIIIIF